MPKNRFFYYDHDACTFVEVQPSRARWMVRAGLVGALALLLGIAASFVPSRPVATPAERAAREEVEALRAQLARANTRLAGFSTELEALAETDRELYRTVLHAEPISEDEFRMGAGGSEDQRLTRYSAPTAQLLHRTTETFDRLERQVEFQSRSYAELSRLARRRAAALRQQPAILPIRGGRLTSGFGMRYHPILHSRRMHAGVDFPTPAGTPIYATGDGEVAFVGAMGGYGLVVEVVHPLAQKRTRYAHLARAAAGIRPDVTVRRGQVIAYSGNTGLSTAPHLHYEVRQTDGDPGTPLDPLATFVPGVSVREYEQLVEDARRETASFD